MVVFPFVTKPANRACANATLYTHQALVSPDWILRLMLWSTPDSSSERDRPAHATRSVWSIQSRHEGQDVWSTKTVMGNASLWEYHNIFRFFFFFLMPLLPLGGAALSTSKTSGLQQNWTYIHTVCLSLIWPYYFTPTPTPPLVSISKGATFYVYSRDHAASPRTRVSLHHGSVHRLPPTRHATLFTPSHSLCGCALKRNDILQLFKT